MRKLLIRFAQEREREKKYKMEREREREKNLREIQRKMYNKINRK
jgi:hypothetical protein